VPRPRGRRPRDLSHGRGRDRGADHLHRRAAAVHHPGHLRAPHVLLLLPHPAASPDCGAARRASAWRHHAVTQTLPVLLAAFGLSASFRTVYMNLRAAAAQEVIETPDALKMLPKSSWQSFFLFGWIPNPRVIDAAGQCGGEGHGARIETENDLGTGF